MSIKSSVAILLLISAFLPLLTLSPPASGASSTIIQTTYPPKFGMDVGPAKWSFSASKFSWASGDGSNITLSLPSYTVVTTSSCAVATTSTFSHTSGATGVYTWTFSGASACASATGAISMTMTVQNVTGAYNEKEIIMSGSLARAGSVSATSEILFPLTFSGTPSACDTNNSPKVCSGLSVGNTAFSWTGMGAGDSGSYSNSTKVLTASVAASASGTLSFTFDPIALDGSNKYSCTSSCPNPGTITLSTSLTNDYVILFISNYKGTAPTSISDSASAVSWQPSARGSASISSVGPSVLTEWYGTAAGALSTDTISVTFGSTPTFEFIIAFGVSGSSGFDSHSGLPYSNVWNHAATDHLPNVTASISSNIDFVFAGETNLDGVTETVGTINGVSATSIRLQQDEGTEYITTSSSFSSGSCQFGSNAGAWAIICDALVQAPTTVTLPIDCIVAESGAASSNSFAVSGGSPSPSPSTITCSYSGGSGTTTSVTVAISTTITVTVPSDTSYTRYRFSVSGSASTATTTTSCSSGTCSTWTITAYYQLSDSYQASTNGVGPPTWDSGLSAAVSGTSLGSAATTCTISPSSGTTTTASCSGWSDFGTADSEPSTMSGAASNIQWAVTGTYSWTDSGSGGNTYTATYYKQLQNTFQWSLVAGTTPASVTWIPTGYLFGTGSSNICTSSPSIGSSSGSCQGWSDYNQAVTAPQYFGSQPANTQLQNAAGTSSTIATPTTGGNTYTAVSYYLQFSNTFKMTPGSPSTWDAAYTKYATGTYLGSAANICTESLSNGGGTATCSGYSDYNAAVSLPSGFASSVAGSWTAQGTYTWTMTSGGNTYTVTYNLIAQYISCTMAEAGAAQATLTLSGASITPTTIACDGNTHNFSWNAGQTVTATEPADGANTRDRFNVGGSPSTTTTTILSTNWFITNYYQLQNTYEATPVGPVVWDAVYSISVTGTNIGTASTLGTISTGIGGGVATSALWADYNTNASLPMAWPDSVHPTSYWYLWFEPHSFTQTTGGNTNNVNYYEPIKGPTGGAVADSYPFLLVGVLIGVVILLTRRKRED